MTSEQLSDVERKAMKHTRAESLHSAWTVFDGVDAGFKAGLTCARESSVDSNPTGKLCGVSARLTGPCDRGGGHPGSHRDVAGNEWEQFSAESSTAPERPEHEAFSEATSEAADKFDERDEEMSWVWLCAKLFFARETSTVTDEQVGQAIGAAHKVYLAERMQCGVPGMAGSSPPRTKNQENLADENYAEQNAEAPEIC